MSSATAPATAIIEATPAAIAPVSIFETAALVAWENYRTKAEPLGLEFGKRLYELRKGISAQGRDGEGLCAWLHKAGIPRRTAYYWIQRYEISIGVQKDISQIEAPKTKSVFEDLIKTLYSLTSSGNDGVEHKFITLLDAAQDYIKANPNKEDGRQTVIYLLKRLSEEFHEHAATLAGQNAEIIQ